MHPQPIAQIKITLMDNGSVNVNGFPNNLELALSYMTAGNIAVVKYFVQLAKDGRLDENNNLIENNILSPKGKLVDAEGRLLQ